MKTRLLRYLLRVLLFLPVVAHAQTVVLTNARLIDGTGATPVENVDIVIANGLVKAVGVDLPAVEGGLVIDA